MVDRWSAWAEDEGAGIRDAGQWRTPRDLDGAGPRGKLVADGLEVVSFASNDYLGLTQHPRVIAAAHDAIERWGAGSGSARLIVGSRPVHSELETELAAWKHAAGAVLFSTGYQANLGVLTTIGGPGTRVLSDELNHASIIDGTRLARGGVVVYPHLDLEKLDDELKASPTERNVVVSDTVFSMDGDVAPVDALVELTAHHGALLVLDEAHAVLGPDLDETPPHVVRMGTLSKTLGSLGGFVAASRPIVDLLVNRARSYIFTTATSPADAAAALAALHVVQGEDGKDLVDRLRDLVDRVSPGHPSPIIPVLCGTEERAVRAAEELLTRGILVPAIRPPTVPVGSSRLRVTLSAAHTDDDVDMLITALRDAGV